MTTPNKKTCDHVIGYGNANSLSIILIWKSDNAEYIPSYVTEFNFCPKCGAKLKEKK